ncbi:ABC transporter permease subunit [Spirillospora sp. NPDC048911]|uniref:ABC transporter permease subunit n=1 Tax=Spirillospora sp. NPDC048911 TaxID=3364527 RepID=UPI003720CA6E
MNTAVSAEWRKLCTVRSTRYILGSPLVALAAGGLVAALMTADWDGSAPAGRATFPAADPAVLAVPFTQFCLAALGALVITSEYATGMIRTSLAAVPRRRTLLAAKAAVVAAVAFLAGLTIAIAAFLLGGLITGDRPAPIAAWESPSEGLAAAFANGLSIAVIGLLGLAIGAVLRSTAGAFVTAGAVLFVLPAVVRMVFPSWGEDIASLLPAGLAPQLAGTADDPMLPPLAALAVMVAYVAITLPAAAFALARRDA